MTFSLLKLSGVVLLQLQALMNATPAMNEPGAMLMSNPEDYNAFIRHLTPLKPSVGLENAMVFEWIAL